MSAQNDSTAAMLATLSEQVRQLTLAVKRVEGRLPAPLVTVEQAAAALGVSRPTIRRWVKAEKVAYVRRGRSIRIDLSRLRPLDASEVRAMGKAA
jgi:excisionase family DNA binding protein